MTPICWVPALYLRRWAWVDETDNNGTIESDGIMQETERNWKM
ncbi:MAG: hypothetical protein ACLVK8_02045 [Ruminococcus sp.]